jgi:hypothetical protein
MDMEKLGIIAFIVFIIWLIASDNSRTVKVHICESDGVSTYVSREDPPNELKFGDCHVEFMQNSRYYRLRQVMKRGAK